VAGAALQPGVTPPQPVSATADLQWEAAESNPLRRVMFYAALATIFLRFSMIHEFLASMLNVNLYLLYIVAPPALLGVLATGGIRRTLSRRPAIYWLGFVAWMCFATLFSSWRGGSAAAVEFYLKSEFIMLFVVAGLAMTWREVKLIAYTIAAAALVDVIMARTFMRQEFDRIDLNSTNTISNANDLAAHLILLSSFVLFVILGRKTPVFLRLIGVPVLGYSFYLIISAGSRGAIIALVLAAAAGFLWGSPKVRTVILVAVPIAALGTVALLPDTTLLRLSTLFSSGEEFAKNSIQEEAAISAELRKALLLKSLEMTLYHPLFGIGPEQFSIVEDQESRQTGKGRGAWLDTHNVFTKISSECGIPALLFYLGAIVGGILLVLKAYHQARSNPGDEDIALMGFCVLVGMVGFLSAIAFLNFAYFFHQPAMTGFCIVYYGAAMHEMAARRARKAPPSAALAPSPAYSSRLR
jgi:O-antigen ligase